MDIKAISDRHAPFMVRRQDTGECAVLMVEITNSGLLLDYKSLSSNIERLFFPEIRHYYGRESGSKITKIEARWLPRRGYESEGYPHTLLVDEKNAQAILRLILLRQGTDIIEVTLETDAEKDKR
ncbi:hypothetical protein VE00_10838 [Pseudogymnoascus sp. WSF 3629]|nr:hypothetical protein VE00_10838 [Pseudogymnoascus sp. WSF 3629]